MGFQEAIRHVFANYTNFSGRARRSEYWYFTLFNILVSGVISILMTMTGKQGFFYHLLMGIDGLFGLLILIPSLALIWRRLHDIGKSGGNFFWIFLPLVGAIMLLVWYCRDSQPGENAYGPNPKEETTQW